MRKLIRNRRAATLDNIFVLIKLFAFALFVLIITLIWNEFTSDSVSSDLWDRTQVGTNVKNNTQVAMDNLDWIFMVAYFGMHIGIIVLAYFLRSHPIVYIAGIFVIIILIMVSAPLSNSWNEIAEESEFVVSAAALPRTKFIMDRLPLFETIFAFLTLIAFAAFARSEQYY